MLDEKMGYRKSFGCIIKNGGYEGNENMRVQEEKIQLRQRMQKLRDAMSDEEHQCADASIWKKICAMDAWKSADWILCYTSFRSEVDTHQILKKLLTAKKTEASKSAVSFTRVKHIALPRVDRSLLSMPSVSTSFEKKKRMNFYEINVWEELTPGGYGILEPSTALFSQNDAIVPRGKVFMLMPGLCFDSHCHRIGYGGGYYDQYLQYMMELKIPVDTVAVAYDFQISSSLPQEGTDILPHCVVTPKHIYYRE
jgi:5-formyltetrahydrofolate cyclo-ligase